MNESSLAPTLLLAMPQMQDPNFARTVVLLCRHEPDGAMGVVVNRRTDTLASSVIDFEKPLRHDSGLRVWQGGPVEPQRGWLLLGFEPAGADSLRVTEGLYLCASIEVLRAAMEDATRPERPARLFLGYAGWGGGQLESELAASAWLTIEVSRQLIFDTEPEAMWEAGIRSLGIDPCALQMGAGIH